MGRNILLDTNILRQLVSATGFSPYLEQLLTWQKQNLIKLYCPKTLKNEWYKHREIKLKDLNSAIKKHQSDIKKSALFKVAPDIDEVQLNLANKILSAQVSAIDDLLEHAVQINDERQAAGLMWEQKTNGKAPFRNKPNSENDAVILFATLDELVRQSEVMLHFFSSNHTDYAAPGNEENIHPDLSAHYPSIKIFYHADMAKGLNELIESGLPSSDKKIKFGKTTVRKFFQEDLNKSVGQRLEDYIKKRFSDINFLPKRLFTIHSPIIIANEYNYRHRSFSMDTDNKAIYDFFVNAIEESKDLLTLETELNHNGSGGRNLIQFFRNNLVHKITFLDSPVLLLPATENIICNCAICTYREGKYEDSFAMLDNIGDEDATMKKAYILYLHGDLCAAVSTLIEVVKMTEDNAAWISYYIAKYNLLLLSRLLRFQSENVTLPESLLNELRETNMDNVLQICRTASLNDILDYLHYGNFLDDTKERMQKLVNRIKDYQIDNVQGSSEDTSSIIELYYESVLFMEHNFLMADSFSDLTSLTGLFIEGLFASYASETTLNGKLTHLTDSIIKKIVTYGKQEDILKYRNRYGIKLIKYEGREGRPSFINELQELCKSYKFLADCSDKKDYVGINNIWTRFRRLFNNSLIMASTLEISDTLVLSICEAIIPVLRIENHLQSYDLTKSLSFFLKTKAHQITDTILEDFFFISFISVNLDFAQLLQVFHKIYKKRQSKLVVSDAWWTNFRSSYFPDSILENNDERIDDLINLYCILENDLFKKEIIDFLLGKLKMKFDRNIYYNAVMIGDFSPTNELTAKYEGEIVLLAKKGREDRLIDSGFYSDYRLDEFINFSLFLNRPFSPHLVEALCGLDDYYKWITDLDSFDYKFFNTNWLSNHLTKYSKNHFRKSERLKSELRSRVMASKDYFLGQLYIDLYSVLD